MKVVAYTFSALPQPISESFFVQLTSNYQQITAKVRTTGSPLFFSHRNKTQVTRQRCKCQLKELCRIYNWKMLTTVQLKALSKDSKHHKLLLSLLYYDFCHKHNTVKNRFIWTRQRMMWTLGRKSIAKSIIAIFWKNPKWLPWVLWFNMWALFRQRTGIKSNSCWWCLCDESTKLPFCS